MKTYLLTDYPSREAQWVAALPMKKVTLLQEATAKASTSPATGGKKGT